MHHPELGRRILDDVVGAVEHLGKVEIFPRQDGRNMTMVLGPDRKAQAASERARRQTENTGEVPAVAADPAAPRPAEPASNGGSAAPQAPASEPAPADPANDG
jgi:translation initiation factor IF-3